MTNKEKVILALKYLGKEYFDTEYDNNLMYVGVARKVLPEHILRDHIRFSFWIPESNVLDAGFLIYHGYNGTFTYTNHLWICICDDDISEPIFKETIPTFADRCLFKAKEEARFKLMKNIISGELKELI